MFCVVCKLTCLTHNPSFKTKNCINGVIKVHNICGCHLVPQANRWSKATSKTHKLVWMFPKDFLKTPNLLLGLKNNEGEKYI